MSEGVRSMRSPIWAPLLRMERCASMAALGEPVVPEVNCMLTMSVAERGEDGVGGFVEVSWVRVDHGVAGLIVLGSRRPEELSTRIMDLRVGIAWEVRVGEDRSDTIDSRML